MNFHFNLQPGVDRASELLVHWFVVMWGYTWAKAILSLWIEKNSRAYTIIGKIISGLIGLAITGGFASIIGLIMFKELDAFITVICIMSVTSAIAICNLYKEHKHTI